MYTSYMHVQIYFLLPSLSFQNLKIKKKIFVFNEVIYLFLAALGLRCCVRSFSSCGERGLLFVVVHGLLIAVTSLLLLSTGSRHAGFSSCGTRAQ